VITEIDQSFEGDVFAPTLGPDWVAVDETTPDWSTSTNGLRYRFRSYRLKSNTTGA
jgi:dihydrofolate reductase